MILYKNQKLLFTIYESKDKYSSEIIFVDTKTNRPFHQWFDGGNMWGNHTISMTWDEVRNIDPVRFKGINGLNWRDYI